ncbi:TIGR00266 family protein [Chakrabartyella piscis]|uniref:TIGR00266 family protein n=1 Tax=Chakrabartyella piscis TaxID=2918914 RepID=UPI002958DB6E|nr:TIGR00266 family protein [Chakrabartyella piscis]
MEYKIFGEPLSAVTCRLQPGETMITESGSMIWMTPNMKMETTSGGGVGKMFGKLLSGEKIFQNRYSAQSGIGEITFGSSFPGSIRAFEITPGNAIIAQKSAFLAGTEGVQLSVHFKKALGTGIFGGEGFIMQKISGSGIAFIEIDGYAAEYTLAAGESMIVDTGYLACMEETCSMDIQTVPGMKNMFLGGEGVFNTVVTGPGKIILQTLPVSGLAASLIPYMPFEAKK